MSMKKLIKKYLEGSILNDIFARKYYIPGIGDLDWNKINLLDSLDESREDAIKYSKEFYNSEDYKNRVKRANIGKDSIINRNKLFEFLDNIPIEIKTYKEDKNLRGNLAYFNLDNNNITFNLDKYKGNSAYINLLLGFFPLYQNIVHEMSHGTDLNYTPFMTEDALEYNNKLIKGNINENLSTEDKYYFGNPSEIRARAMEIITGALKNKISWRDYIKLNPNHHSIIELNNTFKDLESRDNYMDNFVKNDTPLKELLLTPLKELLLYAKQGKKLIKKIKG